MFLVVGGDLLCDGKGVFLIGRNIYVFDSYCMLLVVVVMCGVVVVDVILK